MGQFEKNGGMHNCESSSSKDHRNAGGEREIDGPDRSAPWEKCMLIKFRNFILHYERCGWGRGMQRATMVATKISSLKSLTAPRYTEAEGCGRTLTGINRLAEWQVGWKPPEWSERSKVVSRIEIVRLRIAVAPLEEGSNAQLGLDFPIEAWHDRQSGDHPAGAAWTTIQMISNSA